YFLYSLYNVLEKLSSVVYCPRFFNRPYLHDAVCNRAGSIRHKCDSVLQVVSLDEHKPSERQLRTHEWRQLTLNAPPLWVSNLYGFSRWSEIGRASCRERAERSE